MFLQNECLVQWSSFIKLENLAKSGYGDLLRELQGCAEIPLEISQWKVDMINRNVNVLGKFAVFVWLRFLPRSRSTKLAKSAPANPIGFSLLLQSEAFLTGSFTGMPFSCTYIPKSKVVCMRNEIYFSMLMQLSVLKQVESCCCQSQLYQTDFHSTVAALGNE